MNLLTHRRAAAGKASLPIRSHIRSRDHGRSSMMALVCQGCAIIAKSFPHGRRAAAQMAAGHSSWGHSMIEQVKVHHLARTSQAWVARSKQASTRWFTYRSHLHRQLTAASYLCAEALEIPGRVRQAQCPLASKWAGVNLSLPQAQYGARRQMPRCTACTWCRPLPACELD